MSSPIRHKAKLKFCNITIYEDYILTVMNEGITVLPEYNEILKDLAEKFFKDSNFVYITHRVNSYAVDPIIYLETSKISNLRGFIVVDPKLETNTSLEIEILFLKKPFAAFNELEAAIKFKDSILIKKD